jgi:hypothetical protein
MLHNISAKGRVVRAGLAAFAAIGAALLWPASRVGAALLAAAAAFVGFEATKGWCALRACGVKTRW